MKHLTTLLLALSAIALSGPAPVASPHGSDESHTTGGSCPTGYDVVGTVEIDGVVYCVCLETDGNHVLLVNCDAPRPQASDEDVSKGSLASGIPPQVPGYEYVGRVKIGPYWYWHYVEIDGDDEMFVRIDC